MKKYLILSLFVSLGLLLKAQTECKTIAEIKQQPDKTKILYTGTAKTTFYNGIYNGLFMEDETGGILLKGYAQNSKAKDWVTDSMTVTNITATWSVGSTGSAPGISVASADKEKPQCTFDEPVNPTRITMNEFFANQAAYEGKAIVITDAKISPKVNSKYYMNNGIDSVYFFSSNVSSYAPAGGEMAGVYLGQQYDRFLLSSAEFTKAIEFFSFADMAAYYKGKDYEILDANVGGSVLVNFVAKYGADKSAIFAQYANNTLINGVVIIVDGEVDLQAGDSISGFYGKYTDVYKHKTDKADFKGAYFEQSSEKDIVVNNSNNYVPIVADVTLTDLLSSTTASIYAAQVVASRYVGVLYSVADEYFFKTSYKLDGIDQIDSIRVVAANDLDLSLYCNSNIILAGLYDARVLYSDRPTIVVRDSKDFIEEYCQFETVEDMLSAGEPLSSKVVYELNGSVVVNFQKKQKVENTTTLWGFVEDETGVLAVDFGTLAVDLKEGDSIKGLVGYFSDGYRFGKFSHAPQLQLLETADVDVINAGNELNRIEASLKDIIQNKEKYCSHLVEVSNVGGYVTSFEDSIFSYYMFDVADRSYSMMYDPEQHTESVRLEGVYTIKGLVNYNCLAGISPYVIFCTELTKTSDIIITEIDQTVMCDIYTSESTIIADGEFQIFTVTGQNVTDMNGSLTRGAYIVRTATGVAKVMIK